MSSFSGPLVLASGNAGKLAEFRHILEDLPITLHAQDEFDVEPAEETGLTFVENALLKARAAARQTGLPALADDSGLCVDALGGAPGVRSARFSGGGDAANNMLLLERLADAEDRTAHFHCTLVYLRHAEDPDPLIATGRWPGRIATAPSGDGGFGYDPLFVDPVSGHSAAALSGDRKNAISHRGLAAARLREQLETLYGC
jgi:XTP/dITP diphosphohydrolase